MQGLDVCDFSLEGSTEPQEPPLDFKEETKESLVKFLNLLGIEDAQDNAYTESENSRKKGMELL